MLPVFGRPFDGAFPIGNFFDHDKPIEGDANGYVLTLCGERDTSQVDGHPGYDYRMPQSTPLLAVVMTAGLEAPNFCPQLNRTVQALLVVLVHTAPTGELYASIYGHLSRMDVQAGASVSEGAVIGLSGNTGCSGTPHLHFGVGRSVAGRYVLIDPYGWHALTGIRGSSTRAARRACGFGKTERRDLFDNGADRLGGHARRNESSRQNRRLTDRGRAVDARGSLDEHTSAQATLRSCSSRPSHSRMRFQLVKMRLTILRSASASYA